MNYKNKDALWNGHKQSTPGGEGAAVGTNEKSEPVSTDEGRRHGSAHKGGAHARTRAERTSRAGRHKQELTAQHRKGDKTLARETHGYTKYIQCT